jgi:phenylacetate-CoA ligase
MPDLYFDPATETAPRERLAELQLAKAKALLGEVLTTNAFYRERLTCAGLRDAAEITSLADFSRLPFTTKHDLVSDQAAHPPYGTNLTYPLARYIKQHQTSGTTGKPLRWLDTEESWQWWTRCWGAVYRAAGVGPGDRVFLAFSFGPFIGFWGAYEGARAIGALAIPGGGLSSEQRLQAILDNRISVLVCTPTYALHLAEVARQNHLDIAHGAVRVAIHAGEPGASIPSTRGRIEEAWGAQCFDHTGATEVGATGFSCSARNGVHLNEGEFIFEVIDPRTGTPADEGELVVTNLGRAGMPVIRYRLGDRVRLDRAPCACGRTFARMAGGIIGRTDDMVTVRGINIFPSASEAIVREFPQIVEYRAEVLRRGALDELSLSIEAAADEEYTAGELQRALQERLSLRAQVRLAEPGSLPRFELKARRFFDRRPHE